MPKFCANLSMMFTERPFLERFAAARAAGFTAVEYLFPYDFPADDVRRALDGAGLGQQLFNMPPGDWAAGERGLATLPDRRGEFEAGVDQALSYAAALDCPRLHAMAGIPRDVPPDRAHATYIENLRYAADRLAERGLTLLIEPINTRDMPGFFLSTTTQARAIVEEVGAPNLRIQFDLYHAQIMEGDLATRLKDLLPLTGHIQVAGVPERYEPDIGEVNYPYLFDLLDRLGYDGWIGCEYRPRAGTEAGLGWFRKLGGEG